MASKLVSCMMLSPFQFAKSVPGQQTDALQRARDALIGHLAQNGPTSVDLFLAYCKEAMRAAKASNAKYAAEQISTLTVFDQILKGRSLADDAYFAGVLLLLALTNAIFEQPAFARKHSNVGLGVCGLLASHTYLLDCAALGIFKPQFFGLFRSLFNGIRLAIQGCARDYKPIKAPDTREYALEAAVLSLDDSILGMMAFGLQDSQLERAVYHFKSSLEVRWSFLSFQLLKEPVFRSNAWICLYSRDGVELRANLVEPLEVEIIGKQNIKESCQLAEKLENYRLMLDRNAVGQFVDYEAEALVL